MTKRHRSLRVTPTAPKQAVSPCSCFLLIASHRRTNKWDHGAADLFSAIRGHLEVIKYLLEKQADPNACVGDPRVCPGARTAWHVGALRTRRRLTSPWPECIPPNPRELAWPSFFTPESGFGTEEKGRSMCFVHMFGHGRSRGRQC